MYAHRCPMAQSMMPVGKLLSIDFSGLWIRSLQKEKKNKTTKQTKKPHSNCDMNIFSGRVVFVIQELTLYLSHVQL